MNKAVRLHLKVVEAFQLAELDSENHIYPYCLIQVSNSSDIKRTKVAERTTSPTWNQEFYFTVKNPNTDSLKVFIKDFTKMRSHSVMSTLALRLNEFPLGELYDQWFKLSAVKGVHHGGMIHLMITIDPLYSPKRKFAIQKVEEKIEEKNDENKNEENKEEVAVKVHEPVSPPKEIVPVIKTPPEGRSSSILKRSTDFGSMVDTEDPNKVKISKNEFDFINESPAKMFTIEILDDIILDRDGFGPHWALARIARTVAIKSCDFFTDFAGIGFEEAINKFTLAMRDFLLPSNHDINRNRINAEKDSVLGPLYKLFFIAFDKSIAALRRKLTLVDARKAINDVLVQIDLLRENEKVNNDFLLIKNAMEGATQSYENRNENFIYSATKGIDWKSLGVSAALASLALSSMEHTMNCYICNSFGNRIRLSKKPLSFKVTIVKNDQEQQKQLPPRLNDRSNLPPIAPMMKLSAPKLVPV